MKKRKKTKKARSIKKSQNLSVNKPTSDIKISEAVMKLAEPLIKQYTESSRIRMIVFITVIAWNYSLFSEDERENYLDMLIEKLPEYITAEEVATLSEYVYMQSAKKKEYYPNVTDFIISHDLTISTNGRITLTVSSTPTDGDIKRKNTDIT